MTGGEPEWPGFRNGRTANRDVHRVAQYASEYDVRPISEHIGKAIAAQGHLAGSQETIVPGTRALT
jgi:hypothetical protein